MIQCKVKSDFIANLNTEANQITSDSLLPPFFPNAKILYLSKFTNDMSGKIVYCYSKPQLLRRRFSTFHFTNAVTPNMFNGELRLTLAGYWKYEFYEVYWEVAPFSIDDDSAPRTEKSVLPVGPSIGVVKGLVAIGKMYVGEKSGSQEVQYQEYVEPPQTNYIYQG